MKKKFGRDEVFVNTIETYPHQKFDIFDGQIRYQNESAVSSTAAPLGSVDLYELNVGRESNLIYPVTYKTGDLTAFQGISVSDFNALNYGEEITGSYPASATIARDWYSYTPSSGDSAPAKLRALRNTFLSHAPRSSHFNKDLSNDDIGDISLVSIPSIFYGSSVRKGSVRLKFFVSGSLIAELGDTNRNGVLVETTGSFPGRAAGVVLYEQGFIALTGSWDLDGSHTEPYIPTASAGFAPQWKFWGTTGSAIAGTRCPASVFTMEFSGVSKMSTVTMMARAGYGELNHSNNPTYLKYNDSASVAMTGSSNFREFTDRQIENVARSPYSDSTASFQKTTYISYIGVYDEEGELLGVAKMANPVRKREQDSYTFKLKIDI